MINNSIDDVTSSARFIGITNDDSNISVDANHLNKHTKFSQGNRVRTSDNEVYCRSWSVRNPYSTFQDTIRHDDISSFINRDKVFAKLSVLEDNGMPKIVPN